MSEQDNKDLKRIAAFRKELEIDPRSLVFVALAETLNRMGRYDEAAAVSFAGVAKHPDSVSGRLACAVAEAGRQNIKSALEQIKSALVLDQENPRALALMGSLLLDRGLAGRAVQFLSQAVQLAPNRTEYEDLLRRARRLAKEGSALDLPGLNSGDDEDSEHPWSDRASIPVPSDALDRIEEEDGTELEYQASAMIHDEFATVDQAELANLPNAGSLGGVESTQFASVEDMLGHSRPQAPSRIQSSEELPVSEPRVGGSAADPQTPLTQGAIPEMHDDSELQTRAIHEIRPSVEAPSVRRRQTSDHEIAASRDSAAPKAAPRKLTPLAAPVAKAETKEIEAPADTPKDPSSAVKEAAEVAEDDRPSTMFVDDAVWAIYGAERPGASASKSSSESKKAESVPKKPAESKKAPDQEAGSDRRRSVLIVRTAKHFGQITRALMALLVLGFLCWTGYSVAVERAGSTTVNAAEDIKGIASDISQGSLSSLRNANDALTELLPQVPAAKSALLAARAEVSALIWSRFGGMETYAKQANTDLTKLDLKTPSLEALHAMLLLNTDAADLSKLQSLLDKKQSQFSDSPKLWLLRAELAKLRGLDEEVLSALLEANRLSPKNRSVLFELALWHGDRRDFRGMGERLEEILAEDKYRDDVEALLDYVVVAHLLGDDNLISRLQSRLVGVVRDQGIAIASDEIGRASLVFAVINLIARDRNQAVEHLFSATEAYQMSAEFQLTVAECLQLVSKFQQSKKQLQHVLQTKPGNKRALIGLARADYAELLGFKSKESRFDNAPTKSHQARLAFGQAQLDFMTFTKVRIKMSSGVFPETEYIRASKKLEGEALKKELSFINLSHAARTRLAQGNFEASRTLFEQALRMSQRPEIHSGLGLVLLQEGKLSSAKTSFQSAINMDGDLIEAKLGLARVWTKRGQDLKAIEILERLSSGNALVPEATMLLAETLSKRGDDQGAQDHLVALAKTMPKSSDLWLRIGRSRHANGNAARALIAYRRAVEFSMGLDSKPRVKSRRKPDKRTAVDFLYLGQILASRSAARSKMMYRASTELSGTPKETHYFLGKLLLKSPSSRRAGRRSLKLYLRKAPKGMYASKARKLIRRR